MIEPILQRFARGEDLTREDLCALLRVPVGSRDYYRLLFGSQRVFPQGV